MSWAGVSVGYCSGEGHKRAIYVRRAARNADATEGGAREDALTVYVCARASARVLMDTEVHNSRQSTSQGLRTHQQWHGSAVAH